MSKHLDSLRLTKLSHGETVIAHINAQRDDGAMFGIGFVTDQRVGYYRKGLLGERFETIGVNKVSSVEVSAMLGFKTVKVYTSGDSLILKTTDPKEGVQAFVRAVEERKVGRGTIPPAKDHAVPSRSESDDPIAQLARLGQLRTSGVITEAEFAEKKAALLARI